MKPRALALIAVLLIWGLTGCGSGRSPVEKPAAGSSPSDYPKLASSLFQLTQAADPAAFADQHGLDYSDGEVQVMIELSGGQSALPGGYNIEVISQYQNRIDALVPLKELLQLAKESQIKAIRPPLKPYPHS